MVKQFEAIRWSVTHPRYYPECSCPPVTVSVFLRGMRSFQTPLHLPSAALPKTADRPTATTDGEVLASTLNSICARVTPAWPGLQPDRSSPRYVIVTPHTTAPAAQHHTLIVTDLDSTLRSHHLSAHHQTCRHSNEGL